MSYALLLTDPSASLRALVLKHLIDDADPAELEFLDQHSMDDPVIASLLSLQTESGAWHRGDGAWRGHFHPLMLTCTALHRLALAGLEPEDPAVVSAVEYLFSQQRSDGSWPLPREADDTEGVNESPLQTAVPLFALAASGYAADPRAESAYDWLLSRRFDDGGWPTGLAKGDFRKVAGYRRLPHSPMGCRTNTTMAIQCLALHPDRWQSVEAQRGLDVLLGPESLDKQAFGFDLARILGAEPVTGFIAFYARRDCVTILELCSAIGADRDDPRVARLLDFAESLASDAGILPYPAAPQIERWLTYAFARLQTDWRDASWAPVYASSDVAVPTVGNANRRGPRRF